MRTHVIVLSISLLGFGTPALKAETVQLKCEFWHKRLGQMDDKTFLIDSDARTCNGEPCRISDAELRWHEEGGRVELKMDRVAGEGILTFQSDEMVLFKNCKATKAKS